MKTTKVIITCDLCGNEIAENEAAQLTLPTGLTYDICPDCAQRIIHLPRCVAKQVAVAPPSAPSNEFLERAALGAKCEAVRKKLNISQREYAEKLGVHINTIGNIERNRKAKWRTARVQNVIDQINADYDWHCGGAKKEIL